MADAVAPTAGTENVSSEAALGTPTPQPSVVTQQATTPVVDAAAALAAAQTAAPLETPKAALDDAPPVVIYNDTGDPGLNLALSFIGKLGLGPKNPAVEAATKGDFGPLEGFLSALGKKAEGFEPYIALAKDAYTKGEDRAKQAQGATDAAVHAEVGGVENWKVVKAWASANATPEEKVQVNAAFNAGPVAARAMAAKLNEQYKKAGGTVVTPKSAVNPNATPDKGGPSGATQLTHKEYAAEVQKLARKVGGGNLANNPEYQALGARYLAR